MPCMPVNVDATLDIILAYFQNPATMGKVDRVSYRIFKNHSAPEGFGV